MNEPVLPSPGVEIPAADTGAPMSGGAMLRRAREAQGLDIAALAVSLKVPVKKLEALESDRFDLLPDIVFVRALACSVCRTLKIDSAAILENFPQGTAPRLKPVESGMNVPFRTAQDGAGLSLWEQRSKPVVLAVLLLLVGVVVLVFLPFLQDLEVAGATKSETPSVASAPSESLTTQSQTPAEGGFPAQTLKSPGIGSESMTVAGSGMTTGIVAFKALGPSWVEVVDARGTVQVRKTLSAGEVVGASGVLPLSVVVGRADAMEVQVHGKPFDLPRVSKDNVARFEVK